MKFKEEYIYKGLESISGVAFLVAGLYHLIKINETLNSNNLYSVLDWLFQIALIMLVIKLGFSTLFNKERNEE